METGEVLPVGGGYRLQRRLGQGAFGEVWRAEAPGGVEVAVKLISRTVKPAEARRELEALEVIKRLRHHYLLSLQAFFSLPDRLIIVLELADTSLSARLWECEKTGQGLPPGDLLRYTLEAAEALDYLHEQKVQHRDIKPDNLLLLGSHIKVADFGLARILESVLLQSASQTGTPAYMAPEVWAGKLSPHSDQYSLALTYAELRLARFPLAYNNLANLMFVHLHGQAELDPLPEAEQTVLWRALAKEPAARYRSCMEFAQALIKAWGQPPSSRDEPTGSADAASPMPRPQSPAEVTTLSPGGHQTETSLKPPSVPQPRTVVIPKKPWSPPVRWVIGIGSVLLLALLLWLLSKGGGDDRRWVPGSLPAAEREKVNSNTPKDRRGNADGAKDKAPAPVSPLAKVNEKEPAREAKKQEVEAHQTNRGPPAPAPSQRGVEVGEKVRNSVGMDMVRIAAGSFEMGSDKSQDSLASDHELPRHRVTIARPFCIAAHKTTQGQFRKVLNRNPSSFSAGGDGKDKVAGLDTTGFPVETVSFLDAIEFCNQLSEREGLRVCYRLEVIRRSGDGSIESGKVEKVGAGTGYRLPTEAEWEYCARARTTTRYWVGNDAVNFGE
jgi:serine/threonine protein kinase